VREKYIGKKILLQKFTCEFGVCGMEVGTDSWGGGVTMPKNTLGLQSSFCVIWLSVRLRVAFPLI
jgi:hypothetical protein